MERGTAMSLTDEKEYRIVVNKPNGDGTQWYIEWESDREGYAEIDGVRQ